MELQQLYVSLMLDMKEYAAGLDDAVGRARAFGDRIKGALGGAVQAAGLAATAGVVAVGGAIAGVGAAGLNAFIGYQQQMNEVFTLLPGISDDAMSQMSDDVQAFSREFGTLPEEVVPALYQALSAGVPQDNVFSFLETAQQAAIGGVTDLETAVDGISSVVNAFGAETIDAGQASDLMFTAVRLGKTTFDELAASLFQVNPTAAALGVQFGDVTAALAGMTAQGVPTSVATTQLRQLLVELSKDGGKAANMFQDLSGQTFTEFIANGGNVADALELMQGGASNLGVGIQDLFGSVEAGNAALALSGPNLEGFRANIDAMANSAGATQTAYDTMDGGIGRVIDRLKAFGSTVLLQIGEALAPLLSTVLNFAEGALPTFQNALDGIIAHVEPITQAIGNFMGAFSDSFSDSGDLIGSLVVAFQNLVGPTSDAGVTILNIGLALKDVKDRIMEVITPIIEAVTNFVSWKDVLAALGILIAATLIPIIISLVTTMAPILLTVGAVIAVVALLRNAWENDWNGIQEKVAAAWGVIQPLLEKAKEWLGVHVPAAIETLRAFWVDTAWPAIQRVIEAVWPVIQTIFNAIKDFIVDTLIPTIKTLYEKWTTEWWPTIQTVLENVWTVIETIFTEIGRWVNDNIVPWIEFLQQKWVDEVWPAIQTALETAWGIIEPIWDAIREWAEETIPPILDSLKGTFETVMTGISAAVEPVKAIWDGFVTAVTGFWDWIKNKVFNFEIHIPDLPDWAVPGSPLPIHTAWAKFADDMPQIADDISDGFDEMATSLDGVRDAADDVREAVEAMEPPDVSIWEGAESALDLAGKLGGLASSLGGQFQKRVLDPMATRLESLDETVGSIEPLFDRVMGRYGLAGRLGDWTDPAQYEDVLRKLTYLRNTFNTPDSWMNRAEVDMAIDALNERNSLNQEYIRQLERKQALEQVQSDMEFLKMQMDLINLIRANPDVLDPAMLAGLQLGLGADPGALMDVALGAWEGLVQDAGYELTAGGGILNAPSLSAVTPGAGGGTTYNVQNQTINGGQNIYLYDTEESELERLGVLAR